MTARDLARYGLIFGRRGRGIRGEHVGSAAFIQATLDAAVQSSHGAGRGSAYKNQLETNGSWVGHSGFGGQWMAAVPGKEYSLAYFSVFDENGGVGSSSLLEMTDDIFALLCGGGHVDKDT